MPDIPLAEVPPADPHVTAYDQAHHVAYMRLLDAADEQADWREVARIVLELDVAGDPQRARRVHASHLARARWMCEHGYRDVLKHGLPTPPKR